METIAKEDSRVNKMMKLENIFREDPGLFAAYTDWEFEKKLYDATLMERDNFATFRTFANLIKYGDITLQTAASRAGMTEAEFKAKMAEYNLRLNI